MTLQLRAFDESLTWMIQLRRDARELWRIRKLNNITCLNLPHSAQTWTRGPCVCKCFLIAELSRNILLQPLCGQAVRIENKLEFSLSSKKSKFVQLTNTPNFMLVRIRLLLRGLDLFIYRLCELGELLWVGKINSSHWQRWILNNSFAAHVLGIIGIHLRIRAVLVVRLGGSPHCYAELALHRLDLYLSLLPLSWFGFRFYYVDIVELDVLGRLWNHRWRRRGEAVAVDDALLCRRFARSKVTRRRRKIVDPNQQLPKESEKIQGLSTSWKLSHRNPNKLHSTHKSAPLFLVFSVSHLPILVYWRSLLEINFIFQSHFVYVI